MVFEREAAPQCPRLEYSDFAWWRTQSNDRASEEIWVLKTEIEIPSGAESTSDIHPFASTLEILRDPVPVTR